MAIMEAVSSTQPSAKMDANNNFKGKLFGYARSHGFGDPNYTFENNGLPHAPHFRATVHVAGHTFAAHETFKRRKEAENFISKLAFESLSHKAGINVVSPSSLKGSKLCKTILYEYCVKKDDMVLPSYNTKVPDGEPSTVLFLSQVMYGDNTFLGPLSCSKKEAEQNAAFLVITSLLENSETKFLMLEVIQKVVSAIAGCAEFASNQNPNPNDNASVSSGWIFPNKAYKSILKEYSDKKGCKTYKSVVSFEGNVYNGSVSKSKKEAEQAAARIAVDCILENPESKNFMLQAIQSKIKFNPTWNVTLISNPNPTTDQLNPALISIVENQSAVELSKNARKRARKEHDLETKKVKLNLLVNNLC